MAKTAKKAGPEVVKPEKKKKAAPVALPVPVIKPGAMSVDVGPRVIAGLAQTAESEMQANQVLAEVRSKRYDLLSQLTLAVAKAAKADPSIVLADAFSKDQKVINGLNDRLGIALGFREVVTVGTGDKAKQKVVSAKAVAEFFPMPGDDKNDPLVKRKSTVRSNFLHTLKKCVQAAEGIKASGINAKIDKASGTLKLSGPTIKSTFGEDSVLLNEKLTVGEGEKARKLKEKPSFTAIANIGAKKHGQVMAVRKDSRSQNVDPVTAFVSVCATLVKGIAKLGDKPDAKIKEALASVQSAIDKSGLVE